MKQEQGKSVLGMSREELIRAVRHFKGKAAKFRRQKNQLRREVSTLRRQLHNAPSVEQAA
jgi:uncharacterized coiled-coil DUF342 family protein